MQQARKLQRNHTQCEYVYLELANCHVPFGAVNSLMASFIFWAVVLSKSAPDKQHSVASCQACVRSCSSQSICFHSFIWFYNMKYESCTILCCMTEWWFGEHLTCTYKARKLLWLTCGRGIQCNQSKIFDVNCYLLVDTSSQCNYLLYKT